jgi:hypothetical protein
MTGGQTVRFRAAVAVWCVVVAAACGPDESGSDDGGADLPGDDARDDVEPLDDGGDDDGDAAEDAVDVEEAGDAADDTTGWYCHVADGGFVNPCAPCLPAGLDPAVSDALAAVFPTADRVEALGSGDDARFEAWLGDARIGIALLSAGYGFMGQIYTLLGIDPERHTIRVEFTSAPPGEWTWFLDDPFFDQFRCLDVQRIDIDGRDWGPYPVDAVTGATYTSRGAIESVWMSLERYQRLVGG